MLNEKYSVILRILLAVLLSVLPLLPICANDAEITIGMPYQGGVIAYILQFGDPGFVSGEAHGLIASTADLSTGAEWYNKSYIITWGKGTELGTGQANTTTIVDIQGSGSYAAKLCDDYVNNETGTGVYSDWYLPSKDELDKLYLNKAAVGGFANVIYWSSSEDDDSFIFGDTFAWGQSFSDGDQSTYHKYNNLRVRAVRTF